MYKLISVLLSTIFLLCGCAPPAKNNLKNRKAKNELKYAQRLRMYKTAGYTVAEILDEEDTTKVETTYVLLPEKVNAPAADPNVQVIPVPVSKALVYTSVHASGLDELNVSDIISGVADADYFKLPKVREGLDRGTIRDVGTSASPSAEKIIELAPQVIIVNQYQDADYHVIDNVGIPIIKMAENLETSPLGRAEWIKFLGVLTGTSERADSIFSAVEREYLALKGEAAKKSSHPKVITESMYEGIWYVPGGMSYQAKMLSDAGADYPWKDSQKSGSLPLSYEQVIEKGADADIWLMNVYGYDLSKQKLIEMDGRYKNLQPSKSGMVWYCNTAEKNLFEETPFHPERLLRDYIAIISGRGENLRYFKQMTN